MYFVALTQQRYIFLTSTFSGYTYSVKNRYDTYFLQTQRKKSDKYEINATSVV